MTRGRRASRVLVLTVGFFVMAAEPVAAMTCAPPDPWFWTTISIPQVPDLPAGVSVSAAPRQSEPIDTSSPSNGQSLNWVQIDNSTAVPLYILRDVGEYEGTFHYPFNTWPDVDVGDAPAGMRTNDYLVNSRWWGWNPGCYKPPCGGWFIHDDFVRTDGTPDVTRSLRDGTAGISRGFEDRVTRTNDRPAAPEVPHPQNGTLTLSYDKHIYVIPFVLSYELNPRYDPTYGTNECGAGLNRLILIFIGGSAGSVLLALALAWFVLTAVTKLRRVVPRRPGSSPPL